MKKILVLTFIFLISTNSSACVDLIYRNSFSPALLAPNDAARFLQQATFGPKKQEIQQLQYSGIDDWLDQQICMPPSLITAELQNTEGQLLPARLNLNWQNFVYAPDQLRQRVAFALSEIMVVSQIGFDCGNCPIGIANYHDTLVNNTFGNYRDLLEAISLNPTMGFYLSMLGNAKADPIANTRADENFAREIMQLFSIGLVMLNQDGTLQLDMSMQPIPTYDINHVKELAKIFTGWTWADTASWLFPTADVISPMEPFYEMGTATYHDYSAKQIVGHMGVNSTTEVPAGLSPEDDLALALDTLFNHPNVGPFFSKQLIQRLVTSNPSSAFVQRIATVFNDDGQGIRGNLEAVVRAILTDVEARQEIHYQTDTYGKLREPVLRLTHLWRSLDAEINYQGNNTDFIFLGQQLGQSPYQAPSVFNFFKPDYQSNDIEDENLLAPEFQINNESQLINYQNLLRSLTVFGFTGGINLNFQNVIMNGDSIRSWLLDSNQTLLNSINLLFFSQNMSQTLYDHLNDLLNQYAVDFGHPAELSEAELTTRAGIILYLAMTSPEYLIQK